MKKPYSAPRLYAERFTLVEHITSCSGTADYPQGENVNATQANVCYYTLPNGGPNLFLDGNAACVFKPDPNSADVSLYCYNAAMDMIQTSFTS